MLRKLIIDMGLVLSLSSSYKISLASEHLSKDFEKLSGQPVSTPVSSSTSEARQDSLSSSAVVVVPIHPTYTQMTPSSAASQRTAISILLDKTLLLLLMKK